jgi:phosphatidylserine decarboxylase
MNDFTKPDPKNEYAFPIAKPGYYFISAAAFATAVFALAGLAPFALFGLAVTLFICWFFRDPDRVVPMHEGTVVSPADGKVIIVSPVEENPFIKEKCVKISIFMNVFNVHVNRIPHEGRVKGIDYFPGKFFSANLDKASKENERNSVLIETEKGKAVCMVQIAGLIARRIICGLREGDAVRRGERFGMICFGSRLDVYLPADAKISVSVGDKVRAGSSILGYI